MTLKYLLFCDEAARLNTGKAVLYGVFDAMKIVGKFDEKKGTVHPRMVIAFEIADVELSKVHEVKIEIVHLESKESVFEHAFKPEVKPEGDRIGGFIELTLFQIKHLGNYSANLYLDGKKIGSTSLSVTTMDTSG